MEKRFIFSTKYLKYVEIQPDDRDWQQGQTLEQLRDAYTKMKEVLDAQYSERNGFAK